MASFKEKTNEGEESNKGREIRRRIRDHGLRGPTIEGVERVVKREGEKE